MGLFDFFKKKPAHGATPSSTPPPPPPSPTEKSEAPTVVSAQASKPAPAPASAAADKPEPAPFVEATDAFGRRVRLPRDEYKKNVLPELVKAHGNDPDRLIAVILQAVRDGLPSEVIAAANRLTVIDKDVDRALSVLGVVLRDAGELDAAESTMQELLHKRPDSPNARVGLAMLAEKRGHASRAEELLWQALQKDCNHADAVHCLLQLRHRAVGDAGYRAEIEKIAALPGSWRAQLWLARLSLKDGRTDEASTIYRDVMARAGSESDALVMASGDLVSGHHHALLQELIVPRFQPGRHHPHVGLALLHHFLQTQDVSAGTALLHQMHLHYGHLVAEPLQPFTGEFDRIRMQMLPPPPALSPQARVGLYRMDRPIWYAGLEDPQWLLPKKGADCRQVLLMALAVDGQPSLPPGREDELGRLTRSLPLFLAEHVWLSTPHRGTAALPMAQQGGWAVMGRPWPEESISSQLGDAERSSTTLVTGVLRVEGEKRRIDLWAFDCAEKRRIGHAASEGTMPELGRMLLQLLGELWPAIGGPVGHKPPVGDEAFWHRYADGLGQHAALVVTQAGGLPKDRLYGERYIVQWLQGTALQEPRWQPGFWLYASALGVLRQLGSLVPKEQARIVAQIFRQSPPDSAFARLAVVPLRACGLDGMWRERRAEIVAAAGGDAVYAAWLQRAEA
ncbi:MAG TPA: tetratricopeptide repeat protein [Planctomycetota bacterium]|nr:tetratricopeptide repeat protein [Planctomycetota bacterium]